MPIAPGEHAEILRAIGRLLDAELAEAIELVNYDAAVSLSWRHRRLGTEQRSFREENLEELRRFAAQSRGTYRGDQPETLAEMLRTMGQDLDREGWKLTRIVQEPNAFTVEGWLRDRSVTRKYLAAELIASSKRRRSWRRTEAPPTTTGDASNPGEPPSRSPSWGIDDRGPLSRRLGK